MVYNWEGKEAVCYKMYIEEKKSLKDIMKYMRDHYKFNPSKRAFQTQFKKWDFPSKQHPAYKNTALVQRVKELWDCNTSQRVMLQTLTEEGFDIKERELMRVRAKNRWLLRVPNIVKNKKNNSQDGVISQLQQAFYQDKSLEHPEISGKSSEKVSTQNSLLSSKAASLTLSPEEIKKELYHFSKLRAGSNRLWASIERRRRTREWAGLPADPPGPPRFPSETTIYESKAVLGFDNWLYRDIRTRFQRICEDETIIKKTLAGSERWEAAKDRLIQESQHLQSVFLASPNNLDAKKLALDIVCSDVTKRMRTLERRMTIAEAKNTLGINPEESRQLRNAFYQVLKADYFISKIESGEERWKALKNQWIHDSQLLQNILAPGEADAQHQDRVKALEVLCRDVMKRLRDERTKRDPMRKKLNITSINPEKTEPHGGSTKHNFNSPHQTYVSIIQNQNNQMQSIVDQLVSCPQQTTKDLEGLLLKGKDTSDFPPTLPLSQAIVGHDLQIDPSLLVTSAHNETSTN